jgi:hypothetical protein
MKRLVMLCLIAGAAQVPLMSVAAIAADQAAQAKAGWAIYSQDGCWLGRVYNVGEDGSVKLLLDDKMVIIPAKTIRQVEGKLTTKLTKSDVDGLPRLTKSD